MNILPKKVLIKSIALTVLWLCSFVSITVKAQEASAEVVENSGDTVNQVKFITEDKFMLSGKYFAGKADHSGVLLLHDCKHDSSSYDKLIELISSYGIHALALDLRGYGRSTTNEFSHVNIKKNSKDLITYQGEVTRLTSFWQSDVLAAYNYLRSRISKKRDVAVVSSGCSAAQAVYLTQKMRINSFVMITPILNYMEKEHYKNLIDIPVYFISSAHHAGTYQTTKELFDWNGDNRSVYQLFKGIRVGQSLLKSKRYLSDDIAIWLNDTLSK